MSLEIKQIGGGPKVEKVGRELTKVIPYLGNEFNVDGEDVRGHEPTVTTSERMSAILGHQDPTRGGPIAYFDESGREAFVVNQDVIGEENGFPISPSMVGEEAVHWLRGTAYQPLHKEVEDSETGEIDPKALMKGKTVVEFLGRLGGIACSVEFGGHLDELEYEDMEMPEMFEGDKPADIRRYIWNRDGENLDDWDTYFLDRVSHTAGFNAAAEQYQDAITDEDIIYRDTGQIWLDYDLDEYERDAIDDILGD